MTKNKLFINQWNAGVQNIFWTPIYIFFIYGEKRIIVKTKVITL